MNFFSRLFSSPEAKASAAYAIHYNNLPQAIWNPRSYSSFAKNGYQINVVAFQAINKIAAAIGSMNWVAYDSAGNQLESSPLLDLVNAPNPWQSKQEWWAAKIAYLLIAGESFDERVMGPSGRPQELWSLRPDRMSIKLASSGMPSAYVYSHGGQKITFEANPISGDSDIRHTRLFNPLHDWTGQSPMEAANFAISQHNEAMAWLKSLLQNSARPSGALLLDKDATLTDDQFDRLRGEIEENFVGARNAGRPMLFEGGMKWQEMSLSPSDMAIIEQKDSAARDISLAFGVPPLLLNIPGDNTYSNYREARLGFYEDTIIPLVQHVTGELNPWLSQFFGGHIIAPDYDSIEAISEKRRGLWEMVDSSDEITVNEARELKGFPPIPEPLGSMLMADLRASRRGHTSDRSNNGGSMLGELAYGDETADN
jgi:HK97 family phage portal protein